MRTSFAGLLSAALIAVGSTAPAVILAAAPGPAQATPAGEKGEVTALPTASCIFDRWGNLKVSGPACRLDASKRIACTKANGVVSTVNGVVVCTSRQPGSR